MRFTLAIVSLMVASPAFASDPITDFFNSLNPTINQSTIVNPVYSRHVRRGRRIREVEAFAPVATRHRSGNSMATWYGHEMLGRGHSGRTANGERFNPGGLTAAHKTLPFGTRVRITSPNTGRSVIVRINDRGPYRKGYSYDLAHGAARAIGHNSGAIVATVLN